MKRFMPTLTAAALAAAASFATFAENAPDLTGTWTLEARSSDDPVRVLRGDSGSSRGGRVRGVSIFGIPVGDLPRPADDDDELDREGDLRGVEHVFEATFRLQVRQAAGTTEIRYGNQPSIAYRYGARVERDGAVASVAWQNNVLEIEHELADGTRVSERYWVEARADTLHWTARLKPRKGRALDVERIFHRVPTQEP